MRNLPSKLFYLQSFQKLLLNITAKSVRENLIGLKPSDDFSDEVDWKEALLFASILASSESAEHQDAALRIAQACISSQITNAEAKKGAAIVLHMLANQLGIQLAIKKDLINEEVFENLPLPLKIDVTRRNILYSISSHDGKEIQFNKFQKNVYDLAQDKTYLSVSAPTSAGKSFVMMHIIYEAVMDSIMRDTPDTVLVYIAPTRALISQIGKRIKESFADKGMVHITSVPQKIETREPIIYVLTQERLSWLLNENPSLKVQFLFVDEAHKISDPTRGILLHQTIEDLVTRSPQIKVMFSSPFSNNPQDLFQVLPNNELSISSSGVINTDYSVVNQNIILVNQKPRKKTEYIFELLQKSTEQLKLGTITLSENPHGENNIAYIAYELGKIARGNLIYANNASTAEKWGQLLYSMREKENIIMSSKVEEFIKLVKKVIHKDYILATLLSRRIAFHYGNMPQIIREGIEQLFEEGEIDFLICTSTLLEGVNLPAKSIFIKKPHRGQGKKMSSEDFWNLAGRAGRWGKEFQGNVICIDTESWIHETPKAKQSIRLAKDISSSKIQEVLDYVRADMPRDLARGKSDLEYFFCYCFKYFLENGFLPNLQIEDQKKNELESECKRIKDKVTLPSKVIIRNPGISPLAQQELYDYFLNYEESEISNLIPSYPEKAESWLSYLQIIQRIIGRLSGKPHIAPKYAAVLVVNWMNGYPLARIIQDNWDYWQEKGNKSLPTVIRETMEQLENYVRYEFVKYSSCYIDILRHALRQRGFTELSESIPELHIWLELGVNRKTQISFIDLGLSRHTAIELSTRVSNEGLSRETAAEWLLSFDSNGLDVPQMMVEEVKRVQEEIRILKNSRS